MTPSSKRPEHLAWASLVVSLIFFGIAFFLGRWSGFFAISAVAWHILAATAVWFVLAVQFHQRSLAEQESLDMSQLAGRKDASTIFQSQGEQGTLLAVAQRRLEILEKWFIPIFAVLVALYEIAVGPYLLSALSRLTDVETQSPLVCAIATAAIAFVSFLLSRYATGMSSEPRWRPLRAGGSFLLSVALICFALALTLAGVHFHFSKPVLVVAYIVPILLLVLGLETALNVVLDVYRPRLKGQYSRAAFDSRLLGVINEPGGIFRSAAGAIDYQFGFKVSQTWFYKLLEKAIIPLILFSVVTLYLASCILVVVPHEEALIERFGNPLDGRGEPRKVGPGLRLKLPWPIEMAYVYPTKQIMELYIGYVPKRDPATGRIVPEISLLWGQTHYQEEHDLLVASEYAGDQLSEGAVPVSLVKANIPVQYRIKDLYAYMYHHREPDRLLEAICYRELAKFAASATIEVEPPGHLADETRRNLLGAGRTQAKTILTQRIQQAADEQGLGVEVVFLGLQGIHPPPEVAPDYQAVIGAVQKMQAAVLEAEAERNKTLSTLIGSVAKAHELADLADRHQNARTQGRTEDAERLAKELDEAFDNAKGEIFMILREAQSYAFEKATLAKAAGERFTGQLKAYKAAPEIYTRQQRLVVLEEALKDVRKFVVVADPNDSQVVIVDLQETLTPDPYGFAPGSQESSAQ